MQKRKIRKKTIVSRYLKGNCRYTEQQVLVAYQKPVTKKNVKFVGDYFPKYSLGVSPVIFLKRRVK